MDFTTSKSWLKDIRCIDSTFSPACANKSMKFINEKNRIFSPSNFIHNRFDAFFKLAAVLGTSDHHRKVKNNNPLISKQFWDISINDQLCKAFNNCSFTNACFAKKNRIILGSSAKDLNNPLDFIGSANNGV